MKLRKAQDILHTIRLDAASNNRLRGYTTNLRADKDLKRFDDRMFDYLMEIGDSKFVETEKNYLDSIGFSQSVYEYHKIEEQLHNFQGKSVLNRSWNEHYQRALSSMKAEARRARLKTLKYRNRADIEGAIPKKDTHAGFSYLVTGKRTKGEYMDELTDNLKSELTQAKINGSFNKPILIGTRTQGSGAYDEEGQHTGTCKNKSRLVSMVDIYQVMGESVFARPYQWWLSRQDWYAGGKNDSNIRYFIRTKVNQGFHMLTIDYSNYDQSISYWLIRDAFDIIKCAFEDPEFDDELFEVVVKDFIFKVFIDGDENLIYAEKGVPSGSMFTQIIDSIVNRLMVLTFKHSKHEDIDSMMIMGDDNIIFSRTPINIEEISSYLKQMFGIVAHPDKCSATPPYGNPEFLSRIWKEAGVYRAPGILISKLLYPERFRDYDKEPRFQPHDVVRSYIDGYPLGCVEFLSYRAMTDIREVAKLSDIGGVSKRWLSGVAYYRQNYSSF